MREREREKKREFYLFVSLICQQKTINNRIRVNFYTINK